MAGNLWGREAAELAHEAHVRCVIPCHYEMFEFNTATTAEFVATCEAIGQPYCCLRAGERWSTRQLPPTSKSGRERPITWPVRGHRRLVRTDLK